MSGKKMKALRRAAADESRGRNYGEQKYERKNVRRMLSEDGHGVGESATVEIGPGYRRLYQKMKRGGAGLWKKGC